MSAEAGPRTSKGARTRREFVGRSTDFLLEHGVDGASLRRIARGIGTSHQLLQHHFGNREALLAEVGIELYQRELVRALGIDDPTLPVDQRIWRIWRLYEDDESQQSVALITEITAIALRHRDTFERFLGQVRNFKVPTVMALTAAGIPDDMLDGASELMVALFKGMRVSMATAGDVEASRRAVTALTRLIGAAEPGVAISTLP